MCRNPLAKVTMLVLMLSAWYPRGASAQSTIAGLVTDTSDAILPGVTVEAASPALIEKIRVVTTDSQGRYSIVDLRPGVYSITFRLEGFSTFRREGIEVASNVNVPVNAKLAVGTLEETVTVSGQSPVVDVQVASRTQALNRDMLDALPTARTYTAAGVILPGLKLTGQDMGGTRQVQQSYVSAQGMSTRENAMQVDGMNVKPNNDGSNQQYPNFGMVQEVVYGVNSTSADTSAGGVRINMIPKEGGNTFSGTVFLDGSTGSWQTNNITPELKARGLPAPTAIDYMYDFNPAIGGPLKKDKLWFYGSFRRIISNTLPAGATFNDGRPMVDDQYINGASLRLTWQITRRDKLTLYKDRTWKGIGFDYSNGIPSEVTLAGVSQEAVNTRTPKLYYIAQAKWNSVVSNRMLIETGLSMTAYNVGISYQKDNVAERGSPEWYAGAPRLDFIRGTLRRAPVRVPEQNIAMGYQVSSALSYVTGSHNLKIGVQWLFGPSGNVVGDETRGDLTQRYRNGVPEQVEVRSTPVNTREYLDADLGVYAQDSWTVKRLTITPGIRFEVLKASISASSMAPGRFVPAREVQHVPNLPNWFDVAPRLGLAYDLFGDAKTAIKAGINKYMAHRATGLAKRYNPAANQTDRRDWFDANGDDIAQDIEIGPSNNRNFGFASGRRPDENLTRDYNWEFVVGVQRELLPGVSVNGAWYRRQHFNLEGQRNVLVDVSDYALFQVPNSLTGELITIYNLNRAKQGLVDIVDRNSDINTRIYNGYEASFVARLPNGGTMLGSWVTERNLAITCDTNNPNQLRFCDQTGKLHQDLGRVPKIPYRHEYKFAVAYPLPWQEVQTGLSFFSFSGSQLGVSWPVPANLFPGGRTQSVNVQLIPPGSKFQKRWNQLDVSVNKTFRRGRLNLRPKVEVFNLLNSSVVLDELQTFGTSLGRPSVTSQGRLVKLGVSVTF